MNIFRSYLNGQKESCEDKTMTILNDNDPDNVSNNGHSICGFFPGEIIAKIYYDPTCSLKDIEINNYLVKQNPEESDTNNKIIKNACGYITYANINSKGLFGQDLFRIAFNRYRILH